LAGAGLGKVQHKEQDLKEDLRALVEDATEDLVSFQMTEFGRHHQNTLAVLARRIESLEQKEDQ